MLIASSAFAATLTVQTSSPGPTPDLIGYNSGHFFPGSNTKDWWRYAGVSGARLFFSPSEIEFSDDLAPVGDGVTSRATFDARKAALRANPLNTNYINWSYFSNRYESNDLYPNNHIRPNAALTALRQLGVKPLIQITASETRLAIADTNDWGGMWELWQHYYAQAFYLGRWFDVDRYQMFNEPNHPNANGLTQTNFLLRLQLASDAIQSAIADVNSLYGKSLSARVLAPVTSGNASGSYTGGWGDLVVTNRHLSFFNGSDTNFSLIQTYDYHQYDSSPATFGSSLATLHSLLTAAMAPESRFPTSISEFNTRTGANFDTMTETLDSPTEYARFGAICVNLMNNGLAEFYAFKFSQTESGVGDTYPVQKNAMHYVDNANSPYNIGGINKAGEVYRLFNQAFVAGRTRLNVTKDAGASSLDVQASRDGDRRWLYVVNNNASSMALDLNLTNWNIPTGNRILVEEVSETSYGGVVILTNLAATRIVSGTIPAYGIWLLSATTNAPQTLQTLTAVDDAELRDGANRNSSYGSATTMIVRNDPVNANNRTAALLEFDLAGVALSNLQSAVLAVQASSANVSTTAQVFVYGVTNVNWSQTSVTWASTANLRQNVAAGNTISRAVITGVGTNAFVVGQLVTTTTNITEKRIDVTDFLRGLTGTNVSFLAVQDPRWDVTLPSLVAGDTQPDGIEIVTAEGGSGPQLHLAFFAPPPPNGPPVATNDFFITAEDTPLLVTAPGVLANDSDPETNVLTAVLVAAPTNGTVSLAASGGFTYTPGTNFFGPDAFTYRASDSLTNSGIAMVALTVTPVNDLPSALPDFAGTLINQPVIINALTNDSDPEGGPLAIVSLTPAANGNVATNLDGTITYTPNLNFTGTNTFTYTVSDGQGGTNSALVTITVLTPGPVAYWTNVLATTEAFVRGGINGPTNQDEVTTGYLMVKYNSPSLDAARKTYFQFDLAGLNIVLASNATLNVSTHTNSFRHRAQLWSLNQAYPGFTDAITWNNAQANDTNSNDLSTGGTFTAARIGASFLFPTAGNTPYAFTVTNLADCLVSNRITLVFTGVNDVTNDAGGLRFARTNATLQVLVTPPAPPPATNPPVITSILLNSNRTVTMHFLGTAGAIYRVQGATNLPAFPWLDLSTNVAGTNGFWQFTDPAASNLPARYYRAISP